MTFTGAGSVLMIRPAQFGHNTETAESNSFQHNPDLKGDVHSLALSEFDRACRKLEDAGVNVLIHESSDAGAPDCIFPNNWFSTHGDGRLVLYPMMAPNRRRERHPDIIKKIMAHCRTNQITDLSDKEREGIYLEGTGSIIFDHANKIAYASLGVRTDKNLFEDLCETLQYRPISFKCMDTSGSPVYHTNVILYIGSGYAVVYAEGISDKNERDTLLMTLEQSGKEVIKITAAQVNHFCGNMLQLSDNKGGSVLTCSTTSISSFNKDQVKILERFSDLAVVEIPVIEKVGGGGIRCMLAELFTAHSF